MLTTPIIAPVFEDAANMMVYELYFTQHIQALKIDVLQFVNGEMLQTNRYQR